MLHDRKVYAVIGAAGSGIRMAAPVPKQFIKIGGETILEKTVSVFLRHCAVDKTVVVTSADYLEFTEELFKDAKEADQISVVCGGKQRQDSVYSGLCALRECGAQDDSIVLIHDGVRPYVSEALVSAVAEAAVRHGAAVPSGLCALRECGAQDDSIVLIHDGVRPYVSEALVSAVAEAAVRHGAAVPSVAPKDTIRTRSGETLDRDSLCCVQTPQAFRMELIEKAFEQAFADGFYGTDDAGLTDRIGVRAAIVEGEYENIKITTPEDLKMEYRIGTGYDVHRLEPDRKLVLGGVCMAAIVEGEYENIKITTPEDLKMEYRIGTGYDVHRLEPDRKLVLGGVCIPFEKGLLGHSDADVLVHALMDAMLGAAGLGDIGKLFPDSDPAYSGISSILLLEKTGKAVSEAGYCLGNADITVICQRPRLAPYIEQDPAYSGISSILLLEKTGKAVSEAGYCLGNADITVICQRPRLAPYIEQMRENIAAALAVPKDRISIKATTTEKLGFTGRGEGIASEAVCLLNR